MKFPLFVAIIACFACISNQLPSPVVLYEFQLADCNNDAIQDETATDYIGALTLQPGTTSCQYPYNGVISDYSQSMSLTRMKSELHMTNAIHKLGDEASFEFWLKLGSDQTATMQHVFSVATTSSTHSLTPTSSWEYYMFLMTLESNSLIFHRNVFVESGFDEYGAKTTCALSSSLNFQSLTHLVVNVQVENSALTTNFNIYVNGSLQACTFAIDCDVCGVYYLPINSTRVGNTPGANNFFQFGSLTSAATRQSPESITPLSASDLTMYKFSLFNTLLTPTDISDLYDNGFPTTTAVALNQTLTIAEDGEAVGGSFYTSNPEYYAMPNSIPFTGMYDGRMSFDADEEAGNPNADDGVNHRVKILSLPFVGKFYTGSTGVEITAASLPFTLTSSTGVDFNYRPPFDYYSTDNPDPLIGKVTYHVSDDLFATYSYGETEFFIQSVNDPPNIYSSDIDVIGGTLNEVIANATDREGDAIEFFKVTQLPTNGQLFTINFAGDAVEPIVIDTFYTGQSCVYQADADGQLNPSTGETGSDTFEIVVQDDVGTVSEVVSINFAFMPSFVSVPSATSDVYSIYYQNMVEDSLDDVVENSDAYVHEGDEADVTFKTYMLDIAEQQTEGTVSEAGSRDYYFYASSSPSTGQLRFDGQAVVVDQPYGLFVQVAGADTGVKSIEVNFSSSSNFFNLPDETWNGTDLNPPAVSFGTYSAAIVTSVTVRTFTQSQSIFVLNVNDDPTLQVPSETFFVRAVSTNNDGSDVLIINGIQISDDVDNDVDVLRVTLRTSQGGKLSLNSDHLSKVDFNTGSFCRISSSSADGRWKCQGSGDNDEVMTFVGTPYAANLALQGLKYQNIDPFVTDTVTVEIYDGSYDYTANRRECIDSEDHATVNAYTFHPACFSHSGVFLVEVGDYAGKSVVTASDDVPAQLVWAGVGLGFVGLLILIVALRRHYNKEDYAQWDVDENPGVEDDNNLMLAHSNRSNEFVSSGSSGSNNNLNQSPLPSVKPFSGGQTVSVKDKDTEMKIIHATPENTEADQTLGNWEICHDSDGQEYYFNKQSKRSSWTRPVTTV